MKEKDLIIGPFEAKNKIGLLAFDSDKLYLISLDFKSLLKYSISIQLPFFTKHFDRLKSRKISELINQYKTVELKCSDLKNLQVKRSNWKNYIFIESDNKSIKWNILEPRDTERYEKIFNSVKMNNVC